MADLSSLADLKAASPVQVHPVHVRKVDAQGRAYATGLVKVDLLKVENSMRIRIALETNQEPKTLKVKPADVAQYLINNALG